MRFIFLFSAFIALFSACTGNVTTDAGTACDVDEDCEDGTQCVDDVDGTGRCIPGGDGDGDGDGGLPDGGDGDGDGGIPDGGDGDGDGDGAIALNSPEDPLYLFDDDMVLLDVTEPPSATDCAVRVLSEDGATDLGSIAVSSLEVDVTTALHAAWTTLIDGGDSASDGVAVLLQLACDGVDVGGANGSLVVRRAPTLVLSSVAFVVGSDSVELLVDAETVAVWDGGSAAISIVASSARTCLVASGDDVVTGLEDLVFAGEPNESVTVVTVGAGDAPVLVSGAYVVRCFGNGSTVGALVSDESEALTLSVVTAGELTAVPRVLWTGQTMSVSFDVNGVDPTSCTATLEGLLPGQFVPSSSAFDGSGDATLSYPALLSFPGSGDGNSIVRVACDSVLGAPPILEESVAVAHFVVTSARVDHDVKTAIAWHAPPASDCTLRVIDALTNGEVSHVVGTETDVSEIPFIVADSRFEMHCTNTVHGPSTSERSEVVRVNAWIEEFTATYVNSGVANTLRLDWLARSVRSLIPVCEIFNSEDASKVTNLASEGFTFSGDPGVGHREYQLRCYGEDAPGTLACTDVDVACADVKVWWGVLNDEQLDAADGVEIVTGNVDITSYDGVDLVELAALREVGGALTISNNTVLASVSLPALNVVGGNLVIQSNYDDNGTIVDTTDDTGLTSLSIPLLNDVGGGTFQVSGNGLLPCEQAGALLAQLTVDCPATVFIASNKGVCLPFACPN